MFSNTNHAEISIFNLAALTPVFTHTTRKAMSGCHVSRDANECYFQHDLGSRTSRNNAQHLQRCCTKPSGCGAVHDTCVPADHSQSLPLCLGNSNIWQICVVAGIEAHLTRDMLRGERAGSPQITNSRSCPEVTVL